MQNIQKSKKSSRTLSNTIVYIILSIVAITSIFPFIWMILCTFKTPQEILTVPPRFFPQSPSFDSYKRVWTEIKFSTYFKNSLLITGCVVFTQIYSSALIGYVLGKLKFKGSNVIFTIILSCMMVPWPVTIIPLYQEMVWFKWVGSYKAIIIPWMISLFGIFMIRQFVGSIPDELLEAARIDGCHEFGIFHRIVIPLLKTAISALAILQFLWVWDEFLWPYLMINDNNKFTLPIGLSLFNGQWFVDYGSVMTGATIAVMPVVIVYIIFQKNFIEGIALSGIKA